MRLGRQALGKEYLVAGTYHATIVQVDIVDEKPCTDTVVSQRTLLMGQLHDILIEEQAHLMFRIGSQIEGRTIP